MQFPQQNIFLITIFLYRTTANCSYPDKCDLKQLHLITRYGSRYPETDRIIAFDELEKIFSNVSVAKIGLQLIKRGEIEPYFDGLQSRKRYAKFWDGVKYDPEVIKFQSSQTSRTGASMMAFSEGLFNGKGPLDTCKSQHIYYWTAPLMQDVYYICSSPVGTLAPIAKRISEEFNISPPLNSSLVPYIFNNCQFWLTVFNRTDAWCSLL
ncbi:3750_t:CDS:2, partial [Funneliformis geosporum]